MSIFDDVVGKVTGGATAGGGGQALVTSVLEMLSNRQGGFLGSPRHSSRTDWVTSSRPGLARAAICRFRRTKFSRSSGTNRSKRSPRRPASLLKWPVRNWQSYCQASWTNSPRAGRYRRAAI